MPADAAPPPPDVAPDGPSGPAKLALSVASHDFGWTQQHRPAPDFTFVLTNKGAANSGAPTIAFQGGNRDFAFAVVPSPTGCAGALAPGASCSIVVRYGPEGAGNDGTPDTTSLVVQATPGGTVSAMLIGTPTLSDGLVIAPPHHDFGSAAPGSISAPVTFTLTNTTARTLSGLLYAFDLGVDHPAPPGQGDFLFDASDCMQRAHNTLGPGASCAILVRFQALPGQVGRLRQNWEVYIFNGEAATANVEAGGS